MLPHQPDQVPAPASLSDIHVIETPEQIPLHFAVAGIGSRFLALAIDTLIQTAVAIAVLLLSGVTLAFTGSLKSIPGFSQWSAALLIISGFLLLYGYFACFEVLWNGQTPGKRIIGLRVVKNSGRPLTAAETIGRNLMRIVDSLPMFYAIGVIAALANSENKRLGDFVAGSIVVRESSLKEMKPMWRTGSANASDAAAAAPQVLLGAQGLSMAELTLIDTFLHRRDKLPPDVRARLADEILDRVKSKLSLPPGDASAESILEAAAYQRRSTGAFS
jgi:uncharacterized RDD family membrane protein YckC